MRSIISSPMRHYRGRHDAAIPASAKGPRGKFLGSEIAAGANGSLAVTMRRRSPVRDLSANSINGPVMQTIGKNVVLLCTVLLGISTPTGCKNVDEHLAERTEEIHAYVPDLNAKPENLPECAVDWETAVSMLENNLIMRNAAEEVTKAEVAVKRVFLDLIPQLTLQGIYSQAITQITDLASSNFNANVNALFMVPGIVRLRMDHYGAMLAGYTAQKQYELAYREEVVNLYLLFRQYRHMQVMCTAEALQSANPTFSSTERQALAFQQTQRDMELWLGLSSALGCYTQRWIVDDSNLPALDYLADNPPWDDPNKTGALYVVLEAAELEGARLRELGIKFQYWPQLNMRVYSPSVYLLSAGDRGGFEFDADDIRFEAAVRMKLDTNLQIRDQLRETRRNTDLLKQKLYEDAHERTKKLMEARNALIVIETRRRQIQAKKKLLTTLPEPGTYEDFEANLNERIDLMNRKLALDQELDSVIPVLWVADESRWKKPPL